MTKMQLEIQVNELKAKVIELEIQAEQHTAKFDMLVKAHAECLDELDELINHLKLAQAGYELTCRRCYKSFIGPRDTRYCSRDCEFFRKQVPFEVWYKQMHPTWNGENTGTEPLPGLPPVRMSTI